jgi:hypothetical protein
VTVSPNITAVSEGNELDIYLTLRVKNGITKSGHDFNDQKLFNNN